MKRSARHIKETEGSAELSRPRRRFGADLLLTPAMEDYVKSIFRLSEREARLAQSLPGERRQRSESTNLALTYGQCKVSTQALAGHLQVAAPSVTSMLKRLAELNLVEYEPYYGVSLTELGVHVAAEMIRHHRLIELYLTKALGYSGSEVHEEAEKLEHFISETLEDRIDAALGHPTVDPHGSPIPDVDGIFSSEEAWPLLQFPLNLPGKIVHAPSDCNWVFGSQVEVLGRPNRGKTHLRVDGNELLVEPSQCKDVRVIRLDTLD